MMVTHICEVMHGLKPVLVMVLVQIAYTVMNICYKLITNDGMNLRIFIAYRMMFATAFTGPLALVFERKRRPKLTWMILFQAFLSGLFGGFLAQNLYVECLSLTSATFASAMANLIPAITFILAICFRMEKLAIKTHSGKAKVFGTVMGIGGGMVLTFYKGAEIKIWSSKNILNLINNHSHSYDQHHNKLNNSHSHWLGSLSSLGGSFCFAIWLIIQAKMSKRYPCPYSSTALMSLMGSIQSLVFALCTGATHWNQWKLTSNVALFTAVYSGIVTSGVVVTLVTWCLARRGPVFIGIFTPLTSFLVALTGSLFLNEKLHCGSIVGAALIVCGLYMVLWGKSKEMEIRQKIQLVDTNNVTAADSSTQFKSSNSGVV